MKIKQLAKYSYISFDIFDTLIKRNVAQPIDVFRLVELKYNGLYPNQNITDFSNQRREAERNARLYTPHEDVTYDEIYSQFSGVYNLEEVKRLKELEIQMELETCVINKDMVSIYRYCLEEGKKIILISDMYLPTEVIARILKKNGIDGYEKLYVSSEIGLKKSTGNLFRFVLSDLKIPKKQIIHIGDSTKSDFLRPMLMGIRAIRIPTHINHLRYYNELDIPENELFSYKTMSAFINNHLDGGDPFKVGYETLGPLLYGYTKWLIQDLNEKEIKKVFFLSRDGFLMKNAFDILNNTDIKSRYLYASRRAWVVPSLWLNPELEDVVASFFLVKRMSVNNFLERVGLDPKKYKEIIINHNLKPETIIEQDKIGSKTPFVDFYNSIKEDIIVNSKAEYDILTDYMKQESFSGNIAIVDIGWKGSMQNAILNILGRHNTNTKINGYYLGHRPSKNDKVNDNMFGFLFSPGKNEDLKNKEIYCNPIFETFFTAAHGSVEKYKRENGRITPVLLSHEFSSTTGRLVDENGIISEVQRGAIEFVKVFSQTEMAKYLTNSPYWSVQNLITIGTNPSKHDVDLLGDFRYSDYEMYYFATPKSFFYYLIKPRRIHSDFLKSVWRIGFMKRLIRLPLPYLRMYEWIRSIYLRRENNV